MLVATERPAREVRKLREDEGAVEPEPGDAEDREEDRAHLAREANRAPRLCGEVEAQAKPGIGGRCRRDGARGEAPEDGDGERDASDGERPRAPGHRAEDAAEDGAEQDGDERPHLDQAVAADELLGREVLREDRVLQRAEEGRLNAEEEEDREEHGLVADDHRDRAERHDANLEQLHAAHESGLLG